MNMPVQPGGSRGGPMLEPIAQDVIAAARGQQRQYIPPPPEGYEPSPLTAEDRAEAHKVAEEDARICKYCVGIHRYPTTIACPRIAEADLDGEGKIRRVRFWEGKAWAKGRVVFFEDTQEGDDDGG